MSKLIRFVLIVSVSVSVFTPSVDTVYSANPFCTKNPDLYFHLVCLAGGYRTTPTRLKTIQDGLSALGF